jgi:hypothetical protein
MSIDSTDSAGAYSAGATSGSTNTRPTPGTCRSEWIRSHQVERCRAVRFERQRRQADADGVEDQSAEHDVVALQGEQIGIREQRDIGQVESTGGQPAVCESVDVRDAERVAELKIDPAQERLVVQHVQIERGHDFRARRPAQLGDDDVHAETAAERDRAGRRREANDHRRCGTA